MDDAGAADPASRVPGLPRTPNLRGRRSGSSWLDPCTKGALTIGSACKSSLAVGWPPLACYCRSFTLAEAYAGHSPSIRHNSLSCPLPLRAYLKPAAFLLNLNAHEASGGQSVNKSKRFHIPNSNTLVPAQWFSPGARLRIILCRIANLGDKQHVIGRGFPASHREGLIQIKKEAYP